MAPLSYVTTLSDDVAQLSQEFGRIFESDIIIMLGLKKKIPNSERDDRTEDDFLPEESPEDFISSVKEFVQTRNYLGLIFSNDTLKRGHFKGLTTNFESWLELQEQLSQCPVMSGVDYMKLCDTVLCNAA